MQEQICKKCGKKFFTDLELDATPPMWCVKCELINDYLGPHERLSPPSNTFLRGLWFEALQEIEEAEPEEL